MLMRAIVGVLIVLAVAAGVAGVATYAYNQGVAQGLVQSGKAPVPGPGAGPYPVYPYGYPYGFFYHGPFGFGFFGLLWTVLIVLLVFGLLRRLFWQGPGWSVYGAQDVPRRFEEWHRRAHESKGDRL